MNLWFCLANVVLILLMCFHIYYMSEELKAAKQEYHDSMKELKETRNETKDTVGTRRR